MAVVKLRHPKTRRTITVREDMAGVYRSQGWVEPKKKAEPKPEK